MELKRKDLKGKSLKEIIGFLLENDYNFEMKKEDLSTGIIVYGIIIIYFEEGVFDDCRKI